MNLLHCSPLFNSVVVLSSLILHSDIILPFCCSLFYYSILVYYAVLFSSIIQSYSILWICCSLFHFIIQFCSILLFPSTAIPFYSSNLLFSIFILFITQFCCHHAALLCFIILSESTANRIGFLFYYSILFFFSINLLYYPPPPLNSILLYSGLTFRSDLFFHSAALYTILLF